MVLYFLFCLFSPILFHDILDDMICLVNDDAMFTLDYVDIEEL